MILVDYNDEHIYRMIDVKSDIHRVFSVNWFENKRVNENDVASTSRVLKSRNLLSRDSDFESNSTFTSFTSVSIDNAIDKFLNDLILKIDEFNQSSIMVVLRRIAIVLSNDINTSLSKIDFANFVIFSDFFITLSKHQSSSFASTARDESATNQQDVSNRWFFVLRNRRDTFLDSLALLFKVNFIESHESKIYKEAIFDSNKKRDWQLIMNEKIRSLKNNKIWTICEKLIHRRVLRDK